MKFFDKNGKQITQDTIMRYYTLRAWKEKGTTNRMRIIEGVAKLIREDPHLNNKSRDFLSARMSRTGWCLGELSRMGYGYNTSSEKHSDRDNAGLLSQNNKKSVWVLTHRAS